MISPERLAGLEGSFARLLAAYHVPPYEAYPIFDDLVKRYAEPHRYYHTLEHIAEVLRVVGRLSKFADDPNAVLLAAWFHDAVYDPLAKDNETRSGDLAVQTLDAAVLMPDVVVTVLQLVEATAHHNATGQPDPNIAVLLDADLAILAAEEKRYARYAADIRKEYARVPDEEYRKGRTVVLHAFLARSRIFQTSTMLEEGEDSARRNLRAEIERLERTV